MSSNSPERFLPDIDDDRRTGYSLKSRVLATAVLTLLLVLTFVIVLHLYLRFVLRRRHASGLGRRQTAIALLRARTSAAATTISAPSGMDTEAIAALPTYAHRRTDSNHIDVECPVCLSVVEEGEMVRLLPNCKHTFHVGCIDMWLSSHSTCPVCRAAVEPQQEVVVQQVVLVNEAGGSGGVTDAKEGGPASRLSSSFRRMMSLGRSGRRDEGDVVQDLERQ